MLTSYLFYFITFLFTNILSSIICDYLPYQDCVSRPSVPTTANTVWLKPPNPGLMPRATAEREAMTWPPLTTWGQWSLCWAWVQTRLMTSCGSAFIMGVIKSGVGHWQTKTSTKREGESTVISKEVAKLKCLFDNIMESGTLVEFGPNYFSSVMMVRNIHTWIRIIHFGQLLVRSDNICFVLTTPASVWDHFNFLKCSQGIPDQ